MGKTRDLAKKIRDTKGIFHAKMGPIKDNPFLGHGFQFDIESEQKYILTCKSVVTLC